MPATPAPLGAPGLLKDYFRFPYWNWAERDPETGTYATPELLRSPTWPPGSNEINPFSQFTNPVKIDGKLAPMGHEAMGDFKFVDGASDPYPVCMKDTIYRWLSRKY